MLLLAVTLLGIGLGWLNWTIQRANAQRGLVARLRSSGGNVIYDYMQVAPRSWSSSGKPSGPEWLRKLLGEDWFHFPVYLSLQDGSMPNALPEVNALPRLKTLMIHGKSIDDDALGQLGPLNELEEIHLYEARLSPDGLAQLAKFPKLRWLVLNGTPVSEAGCAALARLENLEELSLDDTGISDDGARQLAALRNLKKLELGRSKVTSDARKELQQAMPNCKISR